MNKEYSQFKILEMGIVGGEGKVHCNPGSILGRYPPGQVLRDYIRAFDR